MSVESGIKPQRLEFVRESTEGETPTDPDWDLYSDQVQSVSPTMSVAISPRRSVGVVDPNDFLPGAEDHEFAVTYDVQQWFTASGDAAYDGMTRDSSNELPSSHSIMMRDQLGGSGEAGGGHYMYTIFKGALVNSVELTGEPESGEPVMATLSYLAEKARSYRVSWPSSSTTLTVQSTDDADTMDLTIEDEGASTTETVTLTGTTSVSTTSSFGSIDAFELTAEPAGDVTIEDGSGNTLVTIYGSASYEDRAGDTGIPALGSGSHASAIGSSFEIFAGDLIERPSGSGGFIDSDDICINSASVTIENNLEATVCIDDIGKKINEGARNINISASIFGAAASYHSVTQHLRAVTSNIKWTLSGGNLEFTNAVLTDAGDISKETETAVMTIDNTFQASGLTIN